MGSIHELNRDQRTEEQTDSGKSSISPETLEALRTGDHRAFEKLYFHYQASILHFLQVLTRSEEIANDITQETFITVWEKRESINPQKNIKTYLYTIARNTAITYFNREKVRERFLHHQPLEGETDTSEELLIAKETDLLIRIAVSRMPRMRRRVFELSRFEGWSNEKIAQELNISKSNVYDHLHQATKDIREVITLFLLLFISQ